MNSLAILICLTAAAAQGQSSSAEDRRTLAEVGLKVVGGQLVDARTYVPPRPAARPRGPRQGGPVCYWWFAGGLGVPSYMEPGLDEYVSLGNPWDAGAPVFGGYGDAYSLIPASTTATVGSLIMIDGMRGKPDAPRDIVPDVPPSSVFEPGKDFPPVDTVKPPTNPVPVSEPSSRWLFLAAIFAWLIMCTLIGRQVAKHQP